MGWRNVIKNREQMIRLLFLIGGVVLSYSFIYMIKPQCSLFLKFFGGGCMGISFGIIAYAVCRTTCDLLKDIVLFTLEILIAFIEGRD